MAGAIRPNFLFVPNLRLYRHPQNKVRHAVLEQAGIEFVTDVVLDKSREAVAHGDTVLQVRKPSFNFLVHTI